MNFIIFILFFIIFSCSYPDIDTVPKFNLKQTMQEKCDFTNQILIENTKVCELYRLHIIQISTRL